MLDKLFKDTSIKENFKILCTNILCNFDKICPFVGTIIQWKQEKSIL